MPTQLLRSGTLTFANAPKFEQQEHLDEPEGRGAVHGEHCSPLLRLGAVYHAIPGVACGENIICRIPSCYEIHAVQRA